MYGTSQQRRMATRIGVTKIKTQKNKIKKINKISSKQK
jgi:hypothetical protein